MELRFDPRGVVLLGRNGTGKTTLLELLASVCKCNPGLVTKDDYDLEFSMSCADDVELTVQTKSEKIQASASSDLASNVEATAVFSAFHQRARRQTLQIEALIPGSGQRTLIEGSNQEIKCTYPDGNYLAFHTPSVGWAALGVGAFQKHSEALLWRAYQELDSSTRNLQRFDEGLVYFHQLTERGQDAATIAAIRSELLQSVDFEAKLISTHCARLLLEGFQNDAEHSTSSSIDSGQIGYLDLFCRLAGFKRARIGVDLDEKQQQGQDLELILLSPLRFSVERNGSVLHHHHLSFGQRRLLAFLHYHDSTPSLIIADELVNGMHHEWISECLQLMRDSQAFLSSQNPLLFDFLTFESAEEVANRFIICELDEQHRFVWRNMSESEAVEFYETHKAGLQHASEILRTRGYW